MTNQRALFTTKLGGILATVGSAVGLGNIWRFPTEAGENGGAAFLLIYFGFVLLLGTPLMMAEFMVGRATHRGAVSAMRQLSPHSGWFLWGYAGSITMLLIVSFYAVVAGWTLSYACFSVVDQLPDFQEYSTRLWMPLGFMTVFFLLNAGILLGGVTKGIERASNILMPILALFLVALCVNSLLLPGARQGLNYLFHPDFSKVNSHVIVSALGQSFFSISCGIGCLLTYGSYLPDHTQLGKTALTITMLDTLIAVLAGVIIFPACFSYNITPDAGPGLAFITLPTVFQQMPGGYFWSIIFFLLLVLAALTSSISLLEGPIAILQEDFHMKRRTAVCVATTTGWVLGVLCSLSLYPELTAHLTIGGRTLFDLFDGLTADVLMPLLGFLMSLFVGWRLPKQFIVEQLTNSGVTSDWLVSVVLFILRFFAPISILLIFLSGLGLF
ncbi:MAG: sodium-dependent transporter [Bacteroidales bacterium]|nr:sodium-dependent transporter [Bacteroidales bacterium]